MTRSLAALTALSLVAACSKPPDGIQPTSVATHSDCNLPSWETTHGLRLGDVVSVDSLDRKLQVISENPPDPSYPRGAGRGVDARIDVAAVVDTAGRVVFADTVDEHLIGHSLDLSTDSEVRGDFRRSALAIVHSTTFTVPLKDGRPVRTVVCLPVNFTGG